jgi:hypothetical protein
VARLRTNERALLPSRFRRCPEGVLPTRKLEQQSAFVVLPFPMGEDDIFVSFFEMYLTMAVKDNLFAIIARAIELE